ncbi:MAG: hypothetical protein KKC75_05730 [Nanoarchaeota archaeon]|nr:hypothetical protein [Nanoarchaeota archaeon]MBU1004924.1 hypothetical protein [Nanoarchaeota archaeon]MBU1945630.1 hypothetical protein [Nanoarchaeota archaeon]
MENNITNNLKSVPNKTTIKVSNTLRAKLAEIGNKDETFEDVIWRMIRRAEPERSGEITTNKSSVIQYKRKKEFIELATYLKDILPIRIEKTGYEYEYNVPPKKEGEWELDIKILKVYHKQKSYNPSEFFGVDNEHKHLSEEFTRIYFQLLVEIIYNEFGIPKWKYVPSADEINIMEFKAIYAKHNLSQESFINDVEDVLRNFSERKVDLKTKKQLENSVAGS